MDLIELTDLLENAGLKYIIDREHIKLYWKIEHNQQLELILFLNDTKDWLIIITALEQMDNQTHMTDLLEYMLRLNYIKFGVKFSINEKKLIFCSIELPVNLVSSELVKNAIIKVIDASKLFLNTKNDLEKLKSD